MSFTQRTLSRSYICRLTVDSNMVPMMRRIHQCEVNPCSELLPVASLLIALLFEVCVLQLQLLARACSAACLAAPKSRSNACTRSPSCYRSTGCSRLDGT